jgi:uncharacterized protein DUF1549/uncharacterized protein DUF1553
MKDSTCRTTQRSSGLRCRFGSSVALSCVLVGALIATYGRARAEDAAPAPADQGSKYSGAGAGDAEVIAYIDAQIRAGWKDSELTSSMKAPENEWCRRVYLDLLGRVPTVDELTQFLKTSASAGKSKKARLLDKILDSDEYVEDYARNWTTIWTTLLIGRPMPREERLMYNRVGMQQYLKQSFLRNKPYDQMAYELISATGATKPGAEGYNGATNFLVGKLQENATEATARVAKYFLGIQVQCTQCHNHPFNDYKQDQFWSMNAFFRQTAATAVRNGPEIDYVNLENHDFRGEGSTPENAEIYFELRNGTQQVAYPTFVDGTKINPSGYVKEVDRRAELGKLVIKSEFFGKSVVNRMWEHFLGYGFTKPVDDLGPHNVPSHPDLLDRLGKEFAANGHDLKKLIRWITLSEAYGLSSKTTPKNSKDDPTLGEKPKFSHFYLRQMQAEELYESLMAATEAGKDKKYEEREAVKAAWLSQFSLTFGNDEGDSATTFNGTIPQVLMMMNGDMIKNATNVAPDSFLYRLANSGKTANEAIEYMYLATLGRKPSGGDYGAIAGTGISGRGDMMTAYQDIWWALLNSNEFIFNH